MMIITEKNFVARYYQYALGLGIFTVLYNLGEGIVSMAFGVHDETLALFGFGVDSFIEVMSGLGIVAMILRIWKSPDMPKSVFEKTALQITGTSFYLLALGLFATALLNLYLGHKPETTLAGVIISLISIATMWALVSAKIHVGQRLNSAPILADANCTKVCIYMSLVLLVASLLYHLTGIGYADSLGALGLVYFSVQEGREAFAKAKGMESCGCGDHHYIGSK
jgi:divalent metal cation (Fe/Co/Zn/Cd) transporter